jgi:hypothetical protein
VYRKAGRGFIWLCEQPLITVAEFIDKGLLRIADTIVWFSKNPTAASRAMVAMLGAVVLRPFNSATQYEQDLERLKRGSAEEPMVSVSLGTGVLLVVIFFTLYLIVYLTHGVFWV